MNSFLKIAAGCAAGLYLARGVEFVVTKIADAVSSKADKADDQAKENNKQFSEVCSGGWGPLNSARRI